ncbi:hypothetical protein HUN92_03725 [Bacillus firmus]|uniref:phospholipase D-like domain-containing protein n=1 Tax=Cytobacillus TaxID=2675230 RepID=UPI0015805AF1|nr:MULTISPECIES: phospholipase D-like domain-containing protein [Cytobacillus]MBZ9534511.1 hypothetical protein [Cytobacillus oceanisediminis]NUH82893.1 hypothetical protein [Cytobacillus firmus]
MTTVYRTYNDIPNEVWKKHIRGSSPALLTQLISELDGAKKISISFFLYNNPYLHAFIEKLVEQGCEVNIYSIPLNGYDERVKELYKSNYSYKDKIRTSKFEYAEKVYKRITTGNKNINLKIFPHTYIWNKQKFSRGSNLYSLHNKSILAEFEDGVKCISSSCNFALGDPPHSDNFLVIKGNANAEKIFKDYFSILDQISLPIDNYISLSKNHFDFEYVVTPVNLKDIYVTDYFTAPFIKYEGMGSNHYIQKKIIEFIQSARNRIYLCSQHFSDIDSFDNKANSLVEQLINVDRNVDIKVLKQTRAHNQAQGWRTAKTEKILKGCPNVSQRYWNPIIHDKFIIVDEKILVTTGNFTPTQFAWQENREMTYLVDEKQNKILNTFSEVNSYHFLEDEVIVNKYLGHFDSLWDKSEVV